MVLSFMVPHFSAFGSGGMAPMPPIILMSAMFRYILFQEKFDPSGVGTKISKSYI
jgi:hypothetical protein